MSTLSKILCKVLGHNYVKTKKITYHVSEYTCTKCKKQLTTDFNGELIELTPKYKEINAVLKRVHINKMKRLKRSITTPHFNMKSA